MQKIIKNLICSGAKDCKSCRSRKMEKHEYLLSKIGFDTAENEPFKFLERGSYMALLGRIRDESVL